ncbi:hypothetical protein NL676_032970 [Syzygium grande]|nr:hypothetical protein NL676_032970 [Syzygium grande]
MSEVCLLAPTPTPPHSDDFSVITLSSRSALSPSRYTPLCPLGFRLSLWFGFESLFPPAPFDPRKCSARGESEVRGERCQEEDQEEEAWRQQEEDDGRAGGRLQVRERVQRWLLISFQAR